MTEDRRRWDWAKVGVESIVQHIHGEALAAMKKNADPYLTTPGHIATHNDMLAEAWAEVEAAIESRYLLLVEAAGEALEVLRPTPVEALRRAMTAEERAGAVLERSLAEMSAFNVLRAALAPLSSQERKNDG